MTPREEVQKTMALKKGDDPNSPGYPIDTRVLAHMSDEELGPLWAQFLLEREES